MPIAIAENLVGDQGSPGYLRNGQVIRGTNAGRLHYRRLVRRARLDRDLQREREAAQRAAAQQARRTAISQIRPSGEGFIVR